MVLAAASHLCMSISTSDLLSHTFVRHEKGLHRFDLRQTFFLSSAICTRFFHPRHHTAHCVWHAVISCLVAYLQAAAAAAREAELARQAAKLLEERMAPLPGPCLVIPGGFERARVRTLMGSPRLSARPSHVANVVHGC